MTLPAASFSSISTHRSLASLEPFHTLPTKARLPLSSTYSQPEHSNGCLATALVLPSADAAEVLQPDCRKTTERIIVTRDICRERAVATRDIFFFICNPAVSLVVIVLAW